MTHTITFTFFLLVLVFTSVLNGHGQSERKEIVISDELSLIPLANNLYQHVSELDAGPEFGKVKCNGLIYINGNDAVICDTPATRSSSSQLLHWMQKTFPHVRIKALIVTHFHEDCLAGLREFHDAGIQSYAHTMTPALLRMKKDTVEIPRNLFSTSLEINIGNEKVINYYAGEAHTRDNIITWIPSRHAIFGGCMVKSMNATKGNLADANVATWSETVRKIKSLCATASIIVPGHGDAGGQELLDYTIALFE